MRILIASGIYPPDIGGPAQYARNLFETWRAQGHEVKVAAYRWERAAPPGLRHLLYLTKVWRKGWNADLILVLDTWSAAVPAMLACKLMRKKYVMRTGGDQLWESYVERTGEKVLFRTFYDEPRVLTGKERMMQRWSGAVLRGAAAVMFNTDWQRQIFLKAYGLKPERMFILNNFCGPHMEPIAPEGRVFLASTRELKWKNLDSLRAAFKEARETVRGRGLEDIELDTGKAVYDNFIERMRRSYAVILASLGDIGPNMILDAVRTGVPFIVTRETGLADMVRECAIFVDPLDEKDVAAKIVWMSDPANRAAQAAKVQKFSYTHTWAEIAAEVVATWKKTVGKKKGKGEK